MISLDPNQEQSVERTKELVEDAIVFGRHLQSAQTGYLHYFYHAQDEDKKDTIPFLENILFALALLRSKIVENINEAKEILEKLLCFQCSQEPNPGINFPFYLHEYPQCRDHFVGIRALAPFYWIIKHFNKVLGSDLNSKLEKNVYSVFLYGQYLHQKQQLPYSIAIRFGAASKAFGSLWNNKELSSQGEKILQDLVNLEVVESWYSTEYLGDMLIAFQMIYPSIKESSWNHFWEYLNNTWHFKTGCYVGPCIREEQKKEEPKPSLYDYFLAIYSKHFPVRLKNSNLNKLHAALIYPSLNFLDESQNLCQIIGSYKNQPWTLIKEKNWAYTLLEKKSSNLNPQICRTLTPFRLIWGDLSRIHSFICSGFDQTDLHYSNHESQGEIFFQLPSETHLDNREKQREINFYTDYYPDLKISVEGSSSSTFELGQKVEINSKELKISLKFELIQGEGQFFGHIMRGNRPNQESNKGENRFKSYDWHIFLRSVRRKGPCLIKAKICIES